MNTQADKSVEGMKLPTTEPGRDMCGGGGAAVGIGMEGGRSFGLVREYFLALFVRYWKKKGVVSVNKS
jgi:hypothetical protein